MLVLLTIFLLLLCCIYKCKFLNKVTKNPPGPTKLQLIGSALFTNKNIREQFYKYAQLYGKLFEIQLFDSNIVVLNTVEMINKAFLKNGEYFNHRPKLFIGDRIGLSESISFRNFDKTHRNTKSELVKSIALYSSSFGDLDDEFQCEIQRILNEIDSKSQDGFEVVGLFQTSIANMFCIMLTGSRASDEQIKYIFDLTSGEDFFLTAFTNTVLSNIPFLVNLPYFKSRLDKTTNAKEVLQDMFINRLKESTEATQGLIPELLRGQNNPLSDKGSISDQNLNAVVVTDLISAGTISTSTVLPCMLFCLVNYPECQRKIQEEIDIAVGRDREPDIKDKQACPFTEAVFMETMRYITPNPFWLPHSCKELIDFEGYQIKENSQIIANSWFIHHDGRIWGDPWTFRPERFLGADGKLLPYNHPYMQSWIPFGVGRRKCPGMKIATSRLFLYVSTIMQRFSLLPVPGMCGSCDPRSDSFVFNLLLNPKPFYCYARRRDQC